MKQNITPEGSLPGERSGFWRTSLLLLSSAAFGGIAVAIWNRRTLALMRQQDEDLSTSQAPQIQSTE